MSQQFQVVEPSVVPAKTENNQSTVPPLYVAAYYGHIDEVNRLLDAKAEVNQPHNTGASPLYFAAQQGRLEIVNRLLDAKAEVDQALNNAGATPLYVAAQNGHLDVVNRLLDAKAEVDQPLKTGATPLFIAAQNGHLGIVDSLSKVKAKIEQPYNGATPLYIAIQKGHLDVVNRLLDAKAEVNQPHNNTGATPLYITVQNGHLGIVDSLIKAKAKIEQPYKGATPLHMAAYKGHIEIGVRLLEHGANLSTVEKITTHEKTLITLAAIKKQYQEKIAQKPASKFDEKSQPITNIPRQPTEQNNSPLHLAVYQGNRKRVKTLLATPEGREMVNLANREGHPPLFIAAFMGHAKIVRQLIKAGAKKDLATAFVAAEEGLLDVVDTLIEAEAIVGLAKKDGTTPLFVAARNGHLAVIASLIRAGATVEATRKNGASPLFIAAQNNQLAAVDLLIQAKANVDTPMKNGMTPLHMAAYNGYIEVGVCLLEHRANLSIVEKLAAKDEKTLATLAAIKKQYQEKIAQASSLKFDEKGQTVSVSGQLTNKLRKLRDLQNRDTTPLLIAAENDDLEEVNSLIKARAEIDPPHQTGATPLFMAAQNGHLSVVTSLIKARAKVNPTSQSGATPLFIAAQNGHLDIVTKLMEARAKVDSPRKDGATPLYIAAYTGNIELGVCLLEHSADRTIAENLAVKDRNPKTSAALVLMEKEFNARADAVENDARARYVKGKEVCVFPLPGAMGIEESSSDYKKPLADGLTQLGKDIFMRSYHRERSPGLVQLVIMINNEFFPLGLHDVLGGVKDAITKIKGLPSEEEQQRQLDILLSAPDFDFLRHHLGSAKIKRFISSWKQGFFSMMSGFNPHINYLFNETTSPTLLGTTITNVQLDPKTGRLEINTVADRLTVTRLADGQKVPLLGDDVTFLGRFQESPADDLPWGVTTRTNHEGFAYHYLIHFCKSRIAQLQKGSLRDDYCELYAELIKDADSAILRSGFLLPLLKNLEGIPRERPELIDQAIISYYLLYKLQMAQQNLDQLEVSPDQQRKLEDDLHYMQIQKNGLLYDLQQICNPMFHIKPETHRASLTNLLALNKDLIDRLAVWDKQGYKIVFDSEATESLMPIYQRPRGFSITPLTSMHMHTPTLLPPFTGSNYPFPLDTVFFDNFKGLLTGETACDAAQQTKYQGSAYHYIVNFCKFRLEQLKKMGEPKALQYGEIIENADRVLLPSLLPLLQQLQQTLKDIPPIEQSETVDQILVDHYSLFKVILHPRPDNPMDDKQTKMPILEMVPVAEDRKAAARPRSPASSFFPAVPISIRKKRKTASPPVSSPSVSTKPADTLSAAPVRFIGGTQPISTTASVGDKDRKAQDYIGKIKADLKKSKGFEKYAAYRKKLTAFGELTRLESNQWVELRNMKEEIEKFLIIKQQQERTETASAAMQSGYVL